jgi:hypothetical protein
VATRKQIDSARRNGAKSKGPITPEGKAKSSRNALKHGLAADPEILLESENDDNYDRLLQAYIDAYNPTSGDEYDLVCQVVSASWRLRRIGRIEARLLEDEMGSAAHILALSGDSAPDVVLEAKGFRSLTYPGRSVDLIIRYTAMARRCFHTALATLRDIQRERRKMEIQNEPELVKVAAKSSRSQPSLAGASRGRQPRGTSVAVFPAPVVHTDALSPFSLPLKAPPPVGSAENDRPKEARC